MQVLAFVSFRSLHNDHHTSHKQRSYMLMIIIQRW